MPLQSRHARPPSPPSPCPPLSLLVLMYHRAVGGPHGNTPAMLEAHFAHIARHYACVLPGERLAEKRLNVCLSFDDAYFDFHRHVLPLIRQHGLRALLAVSPALCPESCNVDVATRLALPEGEDYPHRSAAGFCTWGELRDIVRSGHVRLAAHGLTHAPLGRDADAALEAEEIIRPRAMLEERLGVPVESFVFPFGRCSARSLALVREHYRYAFRIGHACNAGWDAPLLYRIGADRLRSPAEPFSAWRRCRQLARRLWNRARGR